jgi:hypothetical protein
MVRRITCIVAAICAATLLSLGPESAGRDAPEPPAIILSPKADAMVSQAEDIEGELKVKEGWPVVLVKPDKGNHPWWVQEPVQEMDNGKFSANVQFGDEKTPAGTMFRMIIVVAKNKEEAHKIKAGKRDSLPAGLPKSNTVTVSRK